MMESVTWMLGVGNFREQVWGVSRERHHERVRGRLAGTFWRGRRLRGTDRLLAAEVHYLWHVRQQRAWPPRTTLAEYLDSIRRVVLDPRSGVFTNRYQGALSLGIIRESRELRGPLGHNWVLIQYRVERGRWTTAFQPEAGLAELSGPDWEDIRWLRAPGSTSASTGA